MTEIHWGECKDCLSDPINPEISKVLRMKLENFNVENEAISKYTKTAHGINSTNSIVMNTIDFIQHIKKMDALIRTEKQLQMEQTDTLHFSTAAPPCPEEISQPELKPRTLPFQFTNREPRTYSRCKPMQPCNQSNSRKLLRKSVATVLAHAGFDFAASDVLDTFASVAEEYIIKLTKMMRISVDQEALNGSSGFPDVVEKVFHEIGIGNVAALHNYYQKNILQYHKQAVTLSKQLAEEYSNLTLPIVKKEDIEDILRKKDEVEEEDIPELHVPALEDGSSLEQLQPSLKPGFQMLHSLEQEEQLQSLDIKEEINVSDSPNQDLDLLSQESAKKRRRT